METQPRKWAVPARLFAEQKQTIRRLESLRYLANTTRTIYDSTLGGEVHTQMLFGPVTNPRALELYAELSERFGWELPKRADLEPLDNAIATAYAEALALCPIEDKRTTVDERAARDAASRAARAEADAKHAAANAAVDALLAKAPRGAAALIVAELDEDKSDVMTDYFSHTTTRTVAIGWRTGAREDFRQLRRAAAGFPETAHLGPDCDPHVIQATTQDKNREVLGERVTLDAAGDVARWGDKAAVYPSADAALAALNVLQPDRNPAWQPYDVDSMRIHCTGSVEHRDNYSMGGGNYLKDGGSHDSGWRVRSIKLDHLRGGSYRVIEDAIPAPAPAQGARPCAPRAGAGASDAPTGQYDVHPGSNKRGPIFLAVPRARMEREAFESERARAQALSGWYSRQWGNQPGGFGFAEESAAIAFASAPTPGS